MKRCKDCCFCSPEIKMIDSKTGKSLKSIHLCHYYYEQDLEHCYSIENIYQFNNCEGFEHE